MPEITTLENRLQAVSDTTTEADLAVLKADIAGCIPRERIESLRGIIDAKKEISDDTKKKLQSLLRECQASPELQKSPETFERAFEGTKSDMLGPDNVKLLKEYILGRFRECKNLSTLQKDNLATATLDRVLSDKAFSGLFGDMSSSITGGVKSLETGGTSALLNAAFGEKSESSDETKAKVESTTTGITGRIQSIIDNATKPLVELLAKNPAPAGIIGLLGNPRSIAAYDGSGLISIDIAQMTDGEKAEYVKNINQKVLEIDGKIISLEGLRERGMNFVATAPGWMQDIFKWLLSLPLIGNMLASFLGHKDAKEALSGVDEELRQRKTLSVLGEFGKTTDMEGREKEGKYSGKIDILKGQDLSKLSRKKLGRFFSFTKEEGIDSTTQEFWIGVFEKGEIVKKDEKGAVVRYALEKSMKSEDLDKNFGGLYARLNKLHDIVDEKKRKAYSDKRIMLATTTQAPLLTPSEKPTTTVAKTLETPKDEKTLLVEAFNTANNLPFEFGPDKTQVRFEGGKLKIGAKEFSLTLSNGTMEPKVSTITLVGPDVRLGYLAFTKEIKRSQIAEGITGLMTMEPNTIKDIPGEEAGQKLIVKRVA